MQSLRQLLMISYTVPYREENKLRDIVRTVVQHPLGRGMIALLLTVWFGRRLPFCNRSLADSGLVSIKTPSDAMLEYL